MILLIFSYVSSVHFKKHLLVEMMLDTLEIISVKYMFYKSIFNFFGSRQKRVYAVRKERKILQPYIRLEMLIRFWDKMGLVLSKFVY